MIMEKNIIDSLVSLIADRVIEKISPKLNAILAEQVSAKNEDNRFIRGNKALAEKLGVNVMTVQKWRNDGILSSAVLADYGRVIIYDLDKVHNCLRHRPVKQGRRAAV